MQRSQLRWQCRRGMRELDDLLTAYLDRHYEQGPPDNWREAYISAYATMHPWEDWAETWALYLDITSVLDTAANMGLKVVCGAAALMVGWTGRYTAAFRAS